MHMHVYIILYIIYYISLNFVNFETFRGKRERERVLSAEAKCRAFLGITSALNLMTL